MHRAEVAGLHYAFLVGTMIIITLGGENNNEVENTKHKI